MFIHRNKLFKLLVCYSIAAMGLNLFFVLAGNIHFDINVLLFSSLLWGLEAAETAVVLFLFIVTANCLAIINIKTRLYCYNIKWTLTEMKSIENWVSESNGNAVMVAVRPCCCRSHRSLLSSIHLRSLIPFTSLINSRSSYRLQLIQQLR